jgi:hypothetical protein
VKRHEGWDALGGCAVSFRYTCMNPDSH